MYQIDLLCGQGIPERSRPANIMLLSVTIIVPMLIGMMMVGYYIRNRVAISIQKQEIVRLEREMEKLAPAVARYEALARQEKDIQLSLSEVSNNLHSYMQWSGVIKLISESVPPMMTMEKLSAHNKTVQRKIPKKNKPNEYSVRPVPIRELRIHLTGDPSRNWDPEVHEFTQVLRNSELLQDDLEDVRFSRDVKKKNSAETLSFYVTCYFRPCL